MSTSQCPADEPGGRQGCGSAVADLIPPAAVINSFAELKNRTHGRRSSSSPSPLSTAQVYQDTPPKMTANDLLDADHPSAGIDRSLQTGPEDVMDREGDSPAAPNSTEHAKPAHSQTEYKSNDVSSEVSDCDISLNVGLHAPHQDSPSHSVTPIRSVTQAYARLGITARDVNVWDPAAWQAEWKRSGSGDSKDTGLWRLQAIAFIIQDRCV